VGAATWLGEWKTAVFGIHEGFLDVQYTDMDTNSKAPEIVPLSDDGRYIYILLLRYPDRFSRIFSFLFRTRFTHASIGVGDKDFTFFSYVTKGFRKELPRLHPTFKKQEILCRLYRLPISDEVYTSTIESIEQHMEKFELHKFSYVGTVLAHMRISYRSKKRFFCSQFVCEILQQAQAVRLKKRSTLYIPDDFCEMKELEEVYSGFLSGLVRQYNATYLDVPKSPNLNQYIAWAELPIHINMFS